MNIALIGLPSSGKSSLFSLLTGVEHRTGKNGCAEGIARVPDARIDVLSRLFNPRKTTYAQINLTDPPGYSPALSRSIAKGADAVLLVIGAYALAPVAPPSAPGAVAASGDRGRTVVSEFDDLLTDMVMGDLQQVEGTLERLTGARGKPQRSGDIEALEAVRMALEQGLPARAADIGRDALALMSSFGLVTWKPVVVAVNLSETQVSSAGYPGNEGLRARCSGIGAEVVEFSCAIEKEVSLLDPGEQQAFLSAYGLLEPGIHRLARAAYSSAGLISFFTCGEDEVRAWPVRAGATAREAAGRIHSDIERGFIRAEVFTFDDIQELGSIRAIKEAGRLRLESRDYIVRDGDVCSFRFNV
ncbi:MAG: DUF933 domain-containing protein [Ignavibacteriales bacterium]